MDAALARLNDPAAFPLEKTKSVALAIKATGTRQRHIGIIYKDPENPDTATRLLDLGWHHILTAGPVEPTYLWVAPHIEPELSYVLAGLCKKVANKYAIPRRGIAYALEYNGDSFDIATGEFMSKNGLGLTCATFVLAMFASHGIPLLHLTEWRPREDDKAWQLFIIARLEETGASKEHVEAVNEQFKRGCARYRPEEVAAAGAAPELPIGFDYAVELGKLMVAKLGRPG